VCWHLLRTDVKIRNFLRPRSSEAFPTAKIIDPSSLPSKGLIDVKEGKSINPYWPLPGGGGRGTLVGGFTEAEGCFFVITPEGGKSKASYSIRIGYQVSQHNRDQSLIKSLKDFFVAKRVVGQNRGKAAICFRVTKFNNITENIIPSASVVPAGFNSWLNPVRTNPL
jgi:hypothetical protein